MNFFVSTLDSKSTLVYDLKHDKEVHMNINFGTPIRVGSNKVFDLKSNLAVLKELTRDSEGSFRHFPRNGPPCHSSAAVRPT